MGLMFNLFDPFGARGEDFGGKVGTLGMNNKVHWSNKTKSQRDRRKPCRFDFPIFSHQTVPRMRSEIPGPDDHDEWGQATCEDLSDLENAWQQNS